MVPVEQYQFVALMNKVQLYVYQNHQLGKIVTQDSTLPNPKVEDY